MLKKLSLLFVFALTACGWHFNNAAMPEMFRVLNYQTDNQSSEISRVLAQQLKLANVTLSADKNVPALRLDEISTESQTVSVFKNARSAEKVLMLTLRATVSIPQRGDFPLESVVSRTFFDDSRAALAKSTEQEALQQAMYEQAAQQLISKMTQLSKAL